MQLCAEEDAHAAGECDAGEDEAARELAEAELRVQIDRRVIRSVGKIMGYP